MKRILPIFLTLALFFIVACAQESNKIDLPTSTAPVDRSDPWDTGGDYEDDDATVDDDDDALDPVGPDYDPAAAGPYQVGNTTRTFVDPYHFDFWGERTLMTEIWYPAAPETAEMEKDTVDQFIGKWIDLVVTIFGLVLPEDEVANFFKPTRSVRNAPIADGGPFPVVIFGHGNGGVRFQNMHLCEHLASRGYIVLSPDATGNAAVSPLEEELIIYNPIAMPFEFFWRQDDISFLIDTAYWLNFNDDQGVFLGKVDYDNVAASGHSFGAVAALEAAKFETRLKAVVSLAGFTFPFGEQNKMPPGLFFWGWEDHTLIDLNVVQAKQAFEKYTGPKMWVSVNDAGHYSWTDVCDLVPTLMGHGDGCGEGNRLEDDSVFTFVDNETMYNLTNYYVTAFLDWAMLGLDTRDAMKKNILPEQVHMYWKIP